MQSKFQERREKNRCISNLFHQNMNSVKISHGQRMNLRDFIFNKNGYILAGDFEKDGKKLTVIIVCGIPLKIEEGGVLNIREAENVSDIENITCIPIKLDLEKTFDNPTDLKYQFEMDDFMSNISKNRRNSKDFRLTTTEEIIKHLSNI